MCTIYPYTYLGYKSISFELQGLYGWLRCGVGPEACHVCSDVARKSRGIHAYKSCPHWALKCVAVAYVVSFGSLENVVAEGCRLEFTIRRSNATITSPLQKFRLAGPFLRHIPPKCLAQSRSPLTSHFP